MRRLFFILLLALTSLISKGQTPYVLQGTLTFVGGAFNPVFVNGQSEFATGTNTVTMSALSLTSTNTNIVFCRYGWDGVSTVASVTDDAGNTYTRIGSSIGPTSNIDHLEMWVAFNCTGNATNKVVWHFGVGYSPAAFWGGNCQYSGLTSVDVNANGTQGGSATSVTTGSFTTTTANQLLFFVGTVNATGDVITASGYTQRAQDGTAVLTAFDKQVSSIQTGATATMSSNNARSWICIVATFK